MNELAKRIVRGLLLVLCGAAISLLILSIIKTGRVQSKLDEVASQLLYLQDSTAMIQSDLQTMEENIETTLEEESSLIEDYSIQVVSVNLQEQTYDVDITVLPKEYTEATQTSIYFGTRAYDLRLQGLSYKGSATLSLKNSYDGNVTVLFTNGEKRSTEVLHNYVSFPTQLAETLSGSLAEVADSYKDGSWEFGGHISYDLDGHGVFDFTGLTLVAEVDGEKVYDYDLLRESGGEIVTDEPDTTEQTDMDATEAEMDTQTDPAAIGEETQAADAVAGEAQGAEIGTGEEEVPVNGDSTGAETQETSTQDAGDATDAETEQSAPDAETGTEELSGLPEQEIVVSGFGGEQEIHFSSPAAEGDSVKIYLRAVTKSGYTFVLTLWEDTFTGEDAVRAQRYLEVSPYLTLTDKEKNVWSKPE